MNSTASKMVVLVAYLGVGCGSDGSGEGSDVGSQGLPSDAHTCGIVAKVSGGLEHDFGGTLECAGAVAGAGVIDYEGKEGESEKGYVAINFDFSSPPEEGRTGPWGIAGVLLAQRLPGPSGIEMAPLLRWEIRDGGCSLTIKATSPDPVVPDDLLWVNGEGSCSAPAVATGGSAEAPVTIGAFAFNSYVIRGFR
jgi:hypothetical protein